MKPGSKIFCVEDDTGLMELLKIQLEELGFCFCGSSDNAQGAIAGIQKNNPNLVLVDIELHGKFDGLIIGDYLVSKTDIPFIYLTGHDDDPVLKAAKKTIPDGFLLKPFDIKQLRAAIQMSDRN
jgi:DNA-binding response OmpR family regulator